MKPSPEFKNTIKAYLDKRAQEDELFAVSYVKENKNIDDCITYILNDVHKSGYNGFEREEIFSKAVHYYDEDDIEVGKPINCHVVVNHRVELTEEEKENARNAAIDKIRDEEIAKLRQKSEKKIKKEPETVEQTSLF